MSTTDERNAETSRNQVRDFLADVDRQREHGGYLNNTGTLITTWTGDPLAAVTYLAEHHTGFYGSTVTHWRAVDTLGRRWWGKGGGRGMHTTMRRSKHG